MKKEGNGSLEIRSRCDNVIGGLTRDKDWNNGMSVKQYVDRFIKKILYFSLLQ